MKTKAHLLAVGMLLAGLMNSVGQSISVVQFSSAHYTVNESAGSVTLTVERIGEPGGTAFVEYTTRNGSATPNEDYVEQSGALWFFGETNLTIVIPILNDAVAERDETFSVTLFNPDPFNTELGSPTNAVVTIYDNDRGLEFSAYSFTVDEGAGVAVITVVAPDSGNGFSVDYATDGCSATADLDYVPQSGTLNFAAGETEKTFLIPIIKDALVEGDETVNLILSHPVGVPLGPLSNAVLVIRDSNALDVSLDPRRKGLWSASTLGTPSDVAVQGPYAYLLTSFGLQVFDITDPHRLQRVDHADGVAFGDRIVVSDNHAYVASRYSGLTVVDISDPPNPRQVGRYITSAWVSDVAVSGHYMYVGNELDGLQVIDVRDPTNPQQVGSYDTGGFAIAVAVSGDYAYVAERGAWDGTNYAGRLHLLDIRDPTHPQRVGLYTTSGYAQGVTVSGSYAYLVVSYTYDKLEVIDIHDPANPQRVGVYEDAYLSFSWRVQVSGEFAYVARTDFYLEGSGLMVLDVRDPANPQRLGDYDTGGSLGVALAGHYALVAGYSGLDVIDLTNPTNLVRAAEYESLNSPRELAVSGHYVFVADGQAGLRVIDISDPVNPRPVGRITTGSSAASLAVFCNYAVVSGWPRLEVFDISQPANPRRVARYYDGPPTAATAFEGSRAYLAFNSSEACCAEDGLNIIDFSDPTDPRRLGTVILHGHYGVSDLAVSGRYACVANTFGGLLVIDVSDPSNPEGVGWVMDGGETRHVAISGHYAYRIRAGILEVYDLATIATLGNLQQVGAYATRVGFVWYMKVAAGYAYVTGSAGLEIIDIRDPAHPRHAASYPAGGPLAVSGDEAYLVTRTGLEILDLNPLGFRPGPITRSSDGQVQFTLNTRSGQSYTVQASTNLVDWEQLETRTASETKLIFSDTNAPSFNRRFYRAVSP